MLTNNQSCQAWPSQACEIVTGITRDATLYHLKPTIADSDTLPAILYHLNCIQCRTPTQAHFILAAIQVDLARFILSAILYVYQRYYTILACR